MSKKLTCYHCSHNYALNKAGLSNIFNFNITNGGPTIIKTYLWVLHFGLVCLFLATFMPGPNNMQAATGFRS